MKIKQRLINLVFQNPKIRVRYQAMRAKKGRFPSYLYLFWLWLSSGFCSFHSDAPRLYQKGSESSLSLRQSPKEFVNALEGYDVISFDVFDTLLFRPFSDPTDLFYLVGKELSYPDFRAARIQTERELRQKRKEQGMSGEVTLKDIWSALEKETGIPREKGMAAEWAVEQRSCVPNPYMQAVVKLLEEKGKLLAAVSDMYLSPKQIQSLLEQCGYHGFSLILVSSEETVSKGDGGLYNVLKKRVPSKCRMVHIGDNPFSDGKKASLAGISSILYPNVQTMGNRRRTFDLSPIVGSIYRGIANIHLYNGLYTYSPEYEYGFLYGGLFAVGYCRFIHHLAQSRSFQKLFFFSRDGAVLYKAYQKMYPEEKETISYAYWSRQMACKITACLFPREYFHRFLFHKADGSISIQSALESMELSPLTHPLCQKTELDPRQKLTHKNMDTVKSYLQAHWDEVLSLYRPQIEGAKRYYSHLLKDSTRVGAVDIGWMGSGAVMLNAAVNHLFGKNCFITGILAGTLSANSENADAAEPLFLSGALTSYLFSSGINRDLFQFHHPQKDHNLYWELLLGAPEGSVKKILPRHPNGWEICFQTPPPYPEKRKAIHQGILDFVSLFLETEARFGYSLPVSGRDAYAPMLTVLDPKNRKFRKRMEALLDEKQMGEQV